MDRSPQAADVDAGSPTTAEQGRAAQRNSTREALIRAGARAFADHGLNGVRVSQVTDAAGVANGTFYLYFKNKDELLREVVNGLLDDLARDVTQVHETYAHDAPDEGDRAEVEAFVAFVERFPGFIAAFWADGLNGRAMSILAAQRTEELRGMRDDGVVRSDIDLEVTARAETYLLLATLGWWDQDRSTPREELIDSLSRFRTHGTRPLP